MLDQRIPHTTTGWYTDSGCLPLKTARDTNHYTGFPNRTATSLSFADGTGTLTLTSTAGRVWIDGVEYAINTLTKAFDAGLAEATGLYWFWITAPGGVPQLNYSTAPANQFGLCLVATVYWNTATNKGLLSDERHWMGRDKWMHEYLHETVGARYAYGMAFTHPTDATFAIAAGEFYDEDIEHENDAETVATVLYHDGSSAWKWDTAQTTPYKLNGANLVFNNGTTLTDAAANRFVNYFFFVTPDSTDPIHIVIGTAEYTTLAAAQAGAIPTLGDLPSAENKLIFKVTYKNAGPPTWQHTIDYRSSSNLPTTGYVAADHGTLSGLADDDHTQYMLRTDVSNSLAAAALAVEITTFTHATEEKVTLDSEMGDPGNNFASYRYTAPVTGWYHVDFSVYAIPGAQIPNALIAHVKKDGGIGIYGSLAATTGGYVISNGSQLIRLEATNYLELWATAYTVAATGDCTIAPGAQCTFMTVHLVSTG